MLLYFMTWVISDTVANPTQDEIDKLVRSEHTQFVSLRHNDGAIEVLKDISKARETLEFPHGEFDDGKHWKSE